MDAQSAIAAITVVSCLPAVVAPVHHSRTQQDDAQLLSTRDCAALVIEAPAKVVALRLVDDVALDGLGWLIEDPAVAHRPEQLDVFSVRPDQGPRRARGLSSKQFERGKIVAVPNLLGDQPTLICRILHHLQQNFGHILCACRQFIVATLTCQEGPGTPDSGAIKRRSVGMLAVAISVIAIPARTLGKPYP